LEPNGRFTLEKNSEVCGYDHDSYFHGKFLAPPSHRRRLWWRHITPALNEVLGFNMTDYEKTVFLVCCGEVREGGTASLDGVVKGAAK
jgi:hypothetical protein